MQKSVSGNHVKVGMKPCKSDELKSAYFHTFKVKTDGFAHPQFSKTEGFSYTLKSKTDSFLPTLKAKKDGFSHPITFPKRIVFYHGQIA